MHIECMANMKSVCLDVYINQAFNIFHGNYTIIATILNVIMFHSVLYAEISVKEI